jgi:hypothetical protein
MALLYSDAVSYEIINKAADLVVERHARQHDAPLSKLAEVAVYETFCTCVTGAEDMIEHHLSAIHSELINGVIKRAQQILKRNSLSRAADATEASTTAMDEQKQRVEDELDEAERESFPASDPPSLTDPTRTIRLLPNV